MSPALLFTQCLQQDFVQPVQRYEPLPNRLHVGPAEALRLMGERPAEGPVARTLRWAHQAPADALQVFHLRDWHALDDPAAQGHLAQFGSHCLQGSAGAAFAFELPQPVPAHVHVIDSLSLNDFVDTPLTELLRPWADQPCRVGIMGVWTEAKVSFLCYELRTRYPRLDVAVCSALTASSSRQHHFVALDQLARILGVRVIDAVGAFVEFLGGHADDAPLLGIDERFPELACRGLEPSPVDRTLLRYLFRDCRRVELDALDGGFSGNLVAGSRSIDLNGHEQVPHVVKVGPQALMGQERAAFERIQHVLGNSAPQISDFADLGDRGAIRYRYASMGGEFSTTLQKLYMRGAPPQRVQQVLTTVFGEQLGRLYRAATLESGDLLAHYGFAPRWAAGVRRRVEALLGEPAIAPRLRLLDGLDLANVCDFYEDTLAHLPRRPADVFYQSYVHGDLNGANILLDGHDNVWLIDFFHTRRAHVLMDLIKLENDLLYIFTPVPDEDRLRQACALTDALMQVEDLGAPMPEAPPVDDAALAGAWSTLRRLRAFYPDLVRTTRDPFQLWVGQLRYAVHTLGFDESSALQRRWALYTAAACAERVAAYIQRGSELRLDSLPEERTRPGRLSLTLLPGRRDQGRDLAQDLAVLQRQGVRRVLVLVTTEELVRLGVGELLATYRARGLAVKHLPILDQQVCSADDLAAGLDFLEQGLLAGEHALVHCVGGLGRSGMVAACLLRRRGATADEALRVVREVRSPRAVETEAQERMVRSFA